ncbi:hypothetical protein A2368_00020 [Candidatus Collierbacteria bacterium RIFOXYB1_FULL_49_13]|uniref:Uncharacterized protein n=1 Tax=Candidatus Collierbacteria bacterium RIFOXYB1_FULL_49_13 TaxID=1817728 RepID=A0A1F5FFQ1_9BACT|nr:MAG: hypothetical protein A2368_00020 [Candidatus Collierbacteria bacterium RIFOXYB1_FULL_49_13]
MKRLLVAFVTLTVILGLTSAFLAKEMLKKLGFIDDFAADSKHLVTWDYPGAKDWEPGQRNIVLRGQTQFVALVGFKLEIPVLGFSGMDVFGYVRSDKRGVAVVSVYQGKGACEFMFITDTDPAKNRIVISSTDDDQKLMPTVDYPPHLWQKWGIYG